jgi:hypothetical protein
MKLSQFWYGVVVGILVLFVSAAAHAETATKSKAVIAAPKAVNDAKVVGFADLRPGYSPNGSFISENTFRLGYQFKKDRQLVIEQYVNSNLYQPSGLSDSNIRMDDGYIGARLNNLWENKSAGLSFSYAPRFYLPQNPVSREAGLITLHRSNFQLKKTITDSFSLSLFEIPLAFLYTDPGYVKLTGEEVANPIFQNRIYLVADINFTDKLSLSIPLMFYQTRYSNYRPGATNNDAWVNAVYTWPELDYAIDDHMTIGIAFYTDSLVDTHYNQTFDKAFQNGVYQLVFVYNL